MSPRQKCRILSLFPVGRTTSPLLSAMMQISFSNRFRVKEELTNLSTMRCRARKVLNRTVVVFHLWIARLGVPRGDR